MSFHLRMLGLVALAVLATKLLPWVWGLFTLVAVAAAVGFVLGDEWRVRRQSGETEEAWAACRKVRDDRDEVLRRLIELGEERPR